MRGTTPLDIYIFSLSLTLSTNFTPQKYFGTSTYGLGLMFDSRLETSMTPKNTRVLFFIKGLGFRV
jgi:hypothetical protein